MSLPIRNSVKVLLLNDQKQLLLICVDDPKTTTIQGKYYGRFWHLVGGEIEKEETIFDAAIREIYEETGIAKEKITLGPVVWFGEFDLVFNGILTHLKQTFIVAKTRQRKVAFMQLDAWEQVVVKKMKWFSLKEIKKSKEIIYPVVLPIYLPDILVEKYPKEPLFIDLATKPFT